MDGKSSFSIRAAGLSHVGCVRVRNEDAFFIEPGGRYLLVADGMGGHKGGKEASAMAIDLLRAFLDARSPQALKDIDEAELCDLLRDGFVQAALRVSERGRQDPELKGMGTTLVAWVRTEGRFIVGSVGDSRVYLLRGEVLYPLTVDHTLANEQILSGVPRELAQETPMKHVLLRNIGLYPPSDPLVFTMKIDPGDRWLLCSDGLSNKVSDEELGVLFNRFGHDLPALCTELVARACARGGEDNITVVVAEASQTD